MITAVLDTNTIVSANLVERGIPGHVVGLARARRYQLVTSMAIITEVVRTLSHDRIRRKYRVSDLDIERIRLLLEQEAIVIPITVRVERVATHPEDDLILATAASARADYLVTGDKQLLALGAFQGTRIVSSREFLSLLQESGSS